MALNCKETNIEEVKRLGMKDDGKKRPIVVTLNTLGVKINILKNKKKLDCTPYYIKEDFPPEILEERKKLSAQLLEERNNGPPQHPENAIKTIIQPRTIIKAENPWSTISNLEGTTSVNLTANALSTMITIFELGRIYLNTIVDEVYNDFMLGIVLLASICASHKSLNANYGKC
ncbi:Endonuclease-reverse transcriptase [Operophtera brumata]|uniref:Endonuclease-reverse transcriptase n=1 Tax=Operophtera brumata TaxID=104452 RepID=A0A0L7L4T9_OPEBR|nr:Endonuclease-reverse transcriptase [Operophtera brumata]